MGDVLRRVPQVGNVRLNEWACAPKPAEPAGLLIYDQLVDDLLGHRSVALVAFRQRSVHPIPQRDLVHISGVPDPYAGLADHLRDLVDGDSACLLIHPVADDRFGVFTLPVAHGVLDGTLVYGVPRPGVIVVTCLDPIDHLGSCGHGVRHRHGFVPGHTKGVVCCVLLFDGPVRVRHRFHPQLTGLDVVLVLHGQLDLCGVDLQLCGQALVVLCAHRFELLLDWLVVLRFLQYPH